MSVRTTADEYRDKALENIGDAIKNLAFIVVEQTYGWEEYSKEYLYKLQSSMNDLIRIRIGLQ